MDFNKAFNMGDNVSEIICEDGFVIYQITESTGEGHITVHKIFDGVYVLYNDFHMKSCFSQLRPNASTNVFCIDHCREGKLKQVFKEGKYIQVEAGDLRIDDRSKHNSQFELPFSHYHGISILFFLDIAPKSILHVFKDFPVDLNKLKNKYCSDRTPFVIKSIESIEHIFSELYAVPHKIKNTYYKIKILELILFLDTIEIDDCEEIRPYFYKSQVEKVKAINNLMTTNLDIHDTLDELSKRFDISLTPMKKCFKSIYGDSIYSYLRVCRMNRAAVLLRTTEMSVAQIGGEVGYSSPSKFSVAFKKIIGMSPLEYRKHQI